MSLTNPFEYSKCYNNVFETIRSFSHTNIKFCKLTKYATSYIIALAPVCLFPFKMQACLSLSTWPQLSLTLKTKHLLYCYSKYCSPWTCSTEPLGNIETQNCQKHQTQVQTHTYWNNICISIRFPGDFICTLNFVKQVLVFTVEYRELQTALLPPLQRNNV